MIRRLKKDVLSELPSKRRSKVQIQADEKVIKKISNLMKMIQRETGITSTDEVMQSLLADFGHSHSNMNIVEQKQNFNGLGYLSQCFALTAEAKLKASI